MSKQRLIDCNEAIKVIKDLKGNCDHYFYDYALSDAQSELIALPTINPPEWISVDDRMPEPETEVLILAVRSNGYKVITTAMYENGKVSTEDSNWCWYDLDFDYDEENDVYLIPEGWWEYRHYNPDDVLNNAVDDKVTHWMPLPDAPKGSDTNE